ncbi:MAG TPA: adenine deaminase [Flavisolibacter sp.]|jgi:adenine deaminase
MHIIQGQLVDIFNKTVYPAEVEIKDGKIAVIRRLDPPSAAEGLPQAQPTSNFKPQTSNLPFLLPGFIDAHVHIESSMLVPSEFARLAVVHGTVATVSDPHEIANVCGMEGVEYMIGNGKTVPFKFYFGAPSCVPATTFETAGAELGPDDVDRLLQKPEIKYLSEMMNFPGVLNGDADVMQKIASAKKYGKPVDGHAPGLRGETAGKYIAAGISTDHECFTAEEALDKLHRGMKVIIREGSAARNFEALAPLLNEHSGNMMFCSDDKHPDSLVEGHINRLCARAVAQGIDVFKVLQAACINPVLHYKLEAGLLREGDPADLVVVRDLKSFDVLQTYINGELVAENGKTLLPLSSASVINNFSCSRRQPQDFAYASASDSEVPVIEALDGQLITNKIFGNPVTDNGQLHSNVDDDILKIVVVNRYHDAPVAKGFIRNFGLKRGAIASSVAHDSHNIVAVGVDDESLCRAVNLVIDHRGGVSCTGAGEDRVLALPVAGLMSTRDGYAIAEEYAAIDRAAKELGSTLGSPFMSLSFMALLVIPHLKLSDKGLFDGDEFKLVNGEW